MNCSFPCLRHVMEGLESFQTNLQIPDNFGWVRMPHNLVIIVHQDGTKNVLYQPRCPPSPSRFERQETRREEVCKALSLSACAALVRYLEDGMERMSWGKFGVGTPRRGSKCALSKVHFLEIQEYICPGKRKCKGDGRHAEGQWEVHHGTQLRGWDVPKMWWGLWAITPLSAFNSIAPSLNSDKYPGGTSGTLSRTAQTSTSVSSADFALGTNFAWTWREEESLRYLQDFCNAKGDVLILQVKSLISWPYFTTF